MTILKHELRRGKLAFIIWTCAIAAMLAICIFIYPEMKGQMEEMSDMFSSMGSFSDAFGMDQLSFGSLIGYYAVECGNVLGLGGAIFAALTAAGVLCKEEKDKTAEFLLTHPVSRTRIMTEKLISVFIRIIALNLIVCAAVAASMAAVGEAIPWKELALLHTAYFILQIEMAGVCFGISAFLSKGSVAVGIGVAAMLYFLNLIANIADIVAFLKYITPFGYCDGADIVSSGSLDAPKIAIGLVVCILGIIAAYWYYPKKDIK